MQDSPVSLLERDNAQGEPTAITLIGMSGVGKTWISRHLPAQKWFHYSVDYRIGTRYLNEDILDNVKRQMMKDPLLNSLLRNDSIYVKQNITVENLGVLSAYIGKFGSPKKGGLDRKNFFARQKRYERAEKKSMMELPDFLKRATDIYGYQYFINDTTGSLCEIIDVDNPKDDILNLIRKHSLIVYIEADPDAEKHLIQRQLEDPKPIYYNRALFEDFLENYIAENAIAVEEIDPDDFLRSFFPKVIAFRRKRYEKIAKNHGCTISASAVSNIRDEKDFLALINADLSSEHLSVL